MENSYNMGRLGMTQEILKIIAVVAMLIDHIAWKFVETSSLQGQIMHFIGRFTMPIMCYFIAEGFNRTRNVWKYQGRLFLFAAISHFPYQLYAWGEIPLLHPHSKDYVPLAFYMTSVIYTLAMGLLALIVAKRKDLTIFTKIIAIIAIMVLCKYSDYSHFGVMWILAFGLFQRDRRLYSLFFMLITTYFLSTHEVTATNWFMIGTFIPLIFINLYNGEKGGKGHKWFFYIFYPAHLLILAYLKFIVFKDFMWK